MSSFDHRFDEDNWIQLAKMAEVGLCASAMIHEIRQPLSAIKMALQLLKEGEAKDGPNCLENALDQAKRMEQLLVQMRNFLTPSCSEEKEQVDVGVIIKRVVELLCMGPKSKNIEFGTDIPIDLPSVTVSAHKVEQIVFNLLGNAKDAVLECGRGRVLVTASAVAGPILRVVVADDGPGIDPAIGEQIFEPFFTTKDESKGTGLGLFIVKHLAEQSGAAINLLNSEDLAELGIDGFKTGFELLFTANIGKMTVPPPAPEIGTTNRVLIVHEEESEALALETSLREGGMDCDVTGSSDEAVSRLEADTFDLMILDRDLAGITGLELARLARNMNPLMWVLLLFDQSSEHVSGEVQGLKRTYCLFKPLKTDEIKEMARDLLGIGDGRALDSTRETKTDSEPEIAPVEQKPKSVFDGVTVLLIEPRQGVNIRLFGVLHDLGCTVVALDTFASAKEYLEDKTSDVIVASTDTLLKEASWLRKKLSDSSVGAAIAIVEDRSMDKSIEAIHIGARGVFSPPFEAGNIAIELKRVLTWL